MDTRSNMFDLTGKTALVTGGGYGLGRGLVHWLAGHGATVISVARSADALAETFSTLGSEHGQVTFIVPLDATKPEIKVAIEGLFDKKVKAVNTLRVKGKTKRFRGRPGRRSDYKKAVVTFVDGEMPDIMMGV